jgi:hypothetical protein
VGSYDQSWSAWETGLVQCGVHQGLEVEISSGADHSGQDTAVEESGLAFCSQGGVDSL